MQIFIIDLIVVDAIELFPDSIPMSQTDALLDIVDLDQLFDKDQNSNPVNNGHKEIITDTPKQVTSSGIHKIKF